MRLYTLLLSSIIVTFSLIAGVLAMRYYDKRCVDIGYAGAGITISGVICYVPTANFSILLDDALKNKTCGPYLFGCEKKVPHYDEPSI